MGKNYKKIQNDQMEKGQRGETQKYEIEEMTKYNEKNDRMTKISNFKMS